MMKCKYHGREVHTEPVPFVPDGEQKAIDSGTAAVSRSMREWPTCSSEGSVSLQHRVEGDERKATVHFFWECSVCKLDPPTEEAEEEDSAPRPSQHRAMYEADLAVCFAQKTVLKNRWGSTEVAVCREDLRVVSDDPLVIAATKEGTKVLSVPADVRLEIIHRGPDDTVYYKMLRGEHGRRPAQVGDSRNYGVHKQGVNAFVRVPVSMLGLNKNDSVVVDFQEGQLTIKPAPKSEPKPSRARVTHVSYKDVMMTYMVNGIGKVSLLHKNTGFSKQTAERALEGLRTTLSIDLSDFEDWLNDKFPSE